MPTRIATALAPPALIMTLVAVAACGHRGSSQPELPALLSAPEVRATTVALTWADRTLAETGFRIERSTEGGEFEVAGTVAPDVTAFLDAGLQPRTSYQYLIYASLANGSEVSSLPITVVTRTPEIHSTSPTTGFAVGDQEVIVHGDGFSAGVDRVSFQGVPGSRMRIQDDATLVVNTPIGVDVGPAAITLETPTATKQLADGFQFYRWPPTYAPVTELRVGLASKPENVQMVGSGRLAHLSWIEDKPRRMLYSARAEHGRWDEPVLVTPTRSKPLHPHAAVENGNVYIVWVESDLMYLSRSSDGGITYKKPVIVKALPGMPFFPQVAVTGRHVHVVWSDQRVGHGELFHAVSHDGGRTFPRAGFRVNDFLGAFDVRIAASGSDVFVVWWTPEGSGGVKFQRSTDAGDTWTERDQHLGFVTGAVRASAPHLLVDHGRLLLLSHQAGDKRLGIQRSIDHGVSWDPMQILDGSEDPSVSARIAVSRSGDEVCVVWHQKVAGDLAPSIQMNRSRDGGKSWLSTPVRVVSVPGAIDTTPVVCVDGSVVTVAYATQHNSGGSEVFAVHSAGGGPWRGPAWLNRKEARFPTLHCHGGDLVVTWLGCEPSRKSWSLRTASSVPR